MSHPKFITFTGLDNLTPLDEVQALSKAYHGKVEWGVLYGMRTNRFPSYETLEALGSFDIPRALHLCGRVADSMLAGYCDARLMILPLSRRYQRWQVNRPSYPPPERIRRAAKWHERSSLIIQVRGAFPDPVEGLQYLYDESGGTGKVARAWPAPPAGAPPGSYGYAGGMGPHNVQELLARCPAPDDSFWIDMETGVRTGEDFDLAKCRRVLELVYGQ